MPGSLREAASEVAAAALTEPREAAVEITSRCHCHPAEIWLARDPNPRQSLKLDSALVKWSRSCADQNLQIEISG